MTLPAQSAARELGVRLIAADRPGIGSSDRQSSDALLDWPDRRQGAHRTRSSISRFGVVGWSLGGPFAAACAYALPDRVTMLGLVAPVHPRRLGRDGGRPRADWIGATWRAALRPRGLARRRSPLCDSPPPMHRECSSASRSAAYHRSQARALDHGGRHLVRRTPSRKCCASRRACSTTTASWARRGASIRPISRCRRRSGRATTTCWSRRRGADRLQHSHSRLDADDRPRRGPLPPVRALGGDPRRGALGGA